MVNLRVPEGGELLSVEVALNVLKQQIRSDWATLINRRSDTITSARITSTQRPLKTSPRW
jgi:hypothetical protein